MLSAAFAVWFMVSASKNAVTAAPAPKSDEVIVESSSGAALKEPEPLVVSADGASSLAPVREAPPVACFRHALRIFGGDRKQALALCKDGTGNMERIKCAEILVRYLAGAYDEVARACADGGTAATGQCVIDSAHLLQGSWANAISLCAHGGGNENYLCAKQGMIALGGFGDEVTELCHNLRMPFAVPK